MKYIKCPQENSSWVETFNIFLAGGISNCHDWQDAAQKYLSVHLDNRYTVVNPRRDDFDINDQKASDWQIEWEHRHLNRSQIILFWFPHETLCPITLLELGLWCRNKIVIVGVDDNYKRRFDVIKQMSLYQPRIHVKTSLQETLELTVEWAHALYGA